MTMMIRRSLMYGPKPNLTILHAVPQQQTWVIERFGKFQRLQKPGLTLVIPLVDRIAHVRGAMEDQIPVLPQHAITRDNVQVELDGVIYYQVLDVFKSAYEINDPRSAIANLAQSVMRKQVGSMTLDELFHNRQLLNDAIAHGLGNLKDRWGIHVCRYEIQDISMGEHTASAMEKQSAAEREKRATILRSEGYREQRINESEGDRQNAINEAEGKAQATLLAAKATADGIRAIAEAIEEPGGAEAVRAKLATEYVGRVSETLSGAKTVIVPADPLDVNGLMQRALTLSGKV